jgi:hypothetical protein
LNEFLFSLIVLIRLNEALFRQVLKWGVEGGYKGRRGRDGITIITNVKDKRKSVLSPHSGLLSEKTKAEISFSFFIAMPRLNS